MKLPEPEELGSIGRFCHKFRSWLCMPLFKKCEDGIGVGKGVVFGNGSTIIMRDHANIGSYANISGSRATLTIGRHVMMGQRCVIILQNHRYLENGFSGYEGKDVIIDDFAWIGHNVIILPGVRIGRHGIIGAGSVVVRDIPDYAIAVGNPARVKKYRKLIPRVSN